MAKSRELIYLSLLLFCTLFIIIIDIFIQNNDTLLQFLNNYHGVRHLDLIFKIVFLYAFVLIGILYRRWKQTLIKQQGLEDIISSINPDVLMVVDGKETVTMCNNSIKRMLDYELDEVLNKNTNQFVMNINSQTNAVGDLHNKIQQDGFNIKTAIGKKKNGQEIPLEIILGNLGSNKGKVLLLRDISERKKNRSSP